MHSSKFKEIEKRLQYTGEKKCAWCTLLITLFINFHVFAEIGCKTGTFARNARVDIFAGDFFTSYFHPILYRI